MLWKLAAGAVTSIAIFAGFVLVDSQVQLGRRYAVDARPVAVPDDSTLVARGGHLFQSIGCALCHHADGGGKVYMDAGPIGLAVGPNLTSGRGGVATVRSDLDLVRAIRHGVRPDSTSLILMPSEVFVHLTDDDLGAIIGYVRRLAPVDRELPVTHLRPLGRVMLAVGNLNLLVAAKTPKFADPAPVPPARSVAYGRYLANISSCHGCHGAGLSGGPLTGPGLPPASNLTPEGLSSWSEQDFIRALREGRRPDGTELREIMPWKSYRNMTDDELAALWKYLQSVPPMAFGNK